MPESWKMPVFISVHHRAEKHLTNSLVRLVFIKNKRLRSRLMAGPVLLPGKVLISIIARLVSSFNFHYFPACEAVSRAGTSSFNSFK